MKHFFWPILILMACSFAVSGQESMSILPTDQLLVTIIPQSDCPLKVEDAVGVNLLGKRSDILYKVRNSGEKAVKSYTIVKWYSDNTGEVTTGSMLEGGRPLAYNDLSGSLLNKKLFMMHSSLERNTGERNTGRTPKVIKMIAFVMIAEIIFLDGSKYSGINTLNSLKTHLSKIETLYYDN